jgi:hypothetical protein
MELSQAFVNDSRAFCLLKRQEEGAGTSIRELIGRSFAGIMDCHGAVPCWEMVRWVCIQGPPKSTTI